MRPAFYEQYGMYASLHVVLLLSSYCGWWKHWSLRRQHNLPKLGMQQGLEARQWGSQVHTDPLKTVISEISLPEPPNPTFLMFIRAELASFEYMVWVSQKFHSTKIIRKHISLGCPTLLVHRRDPWMWVGSQPTRFSRDQKQQGCDWSPDSLTFSYLETEKQKEKHQLWMLLSQEWAET